MCKVKYFNSFHAVQASTIAFQMKNLMNNNAPTL